MNKHSSLSASGSLFERATSIYDFDEALKGRAAPAVEAPADTPPPAVEIVPELAVPPFEEPQFRAPAWTGPVQYVDRERLVEAGYLLPGGAVSAMSEEFRLLKRDLLTQLQDNMRGNRILICSAHSGEGKSFCAINLAISLAAEKDREILLVDADFGKPGIPDALGLVAGHGLMDALSNPAIAIEDCVVRTDIPSLAVLPAGQPSNNDTEYLSSARTDALLTRLTEGRPERIILFDSPPLLAASAAAVLAGHAAISLLVVRADRTNESALREAAAMLKGGTQVQLLLNGIRFGAGARRFGGYHSKEGGSS